MDVSKFDDFTTFSHPLDRFLKLDKHPLFRERGELFWPSRKRLLLRCCNARLVRLFLHAVGVSGSLVESLDMYQQKVHFSLWCVVPFTALCRSSVCCAYLSCLFYFLLLQFLFHSLLFCTFFVFARLFYLSLSLLVSFSLIQTLAGWCAVCFYSVTMLGCRCFTVFGCVISPAAKRQALQKIYYFWLLSWFWDV